MTHLTPDEFVDAVEGTLLPERRAHVEQCPACREESARLALVLGEARAMDVPEPSPLFWDRLSSRVRTAIADEEGTRAAWPLAWLRWNVLVPLGALALVIAALAVAIPDRLVPAVAVDSTPASGVGDAAIDPASMGTPAWTVLADIVGPVAVEHAREAGIVVHPGDVERVALELNVAERIELLRLLKEETDAGSLQ